MKLAEALLRITECLREMNEEFAVVGGLAASARGEVRFTRDIDIVVSAGDDSAAEHCVFRLGQRGYRVVTTVEQDATGPLATARLLDCRAVVCDLRRAGLKPKSCRALRFWSSFRRVRPPPPPCEALLAMKTLSATPARPRDLGDIQAIVRANPQFDEPLLLSLLVSIEKRGYSRNQTLVAKWHELRATLNV